ncbi:MAG: AAA family ATPase, partial [Clostridiales bacterium]
MELIKSCEILDNKTKQLEEFYIERLEYENKLEDALSDKKIAVLTGFPGVGKTQIVLNYINKHRGKYKKIFFVNSKSYLSLLKGYSKFLDLNEDISSRFKAKKWFEKNENWLLVYDEMDTDEVKGFFESGHIVNSNNGDVIITSSLNSWKNKIEVSCFNINESILFLSNLTGLNDLDLNRKLSVMLGNYPIALKLAANYINKNLIDFDEFISKLDKTDFKILDLENCLNKEFHNMIDITTHVFSIIFNKIEEFNLINYLGVFSYFSNDYINKDLFEIIYERY